MICPKCQKETPAHRDKCVHCGASLVRATDFPQKEKQPQSGEYPSDRKDKSGVPDDYTEGKTAFVRSDSQEGAGIPPRPIPKKAPVSDMGATHLPAGDKQQKPGIPHTGSTDKKTPDGSLKKEEKPHEQHHDVSGKSLTDQTGKEQQPDTELELLRKALAGRYDITRKLGTGGMACVYHAREIALDREVAIKLLPQSLLRDEQFVIRFKREAQVAANLEHPHIVRIYQIGEEENLVYFVMSYIPGGSISDQIKNRGALSIDDIVQWGMDVSSALGYAHDHGVIHRDLKPDNIMLDKNKRAVVMDFGIARAAQSTGLTQTGTVIGTPQFMSPEQARGIELDARSDIYSMGLVLYQMATGSLPFKASDPASLMYMHVHETPESPDVRNKEVPPWLRDIILKCLAKNPDDRFSHAKELRQSLAEHKAPELITPTLVEKKKAAKKISTGFLIGAAVIIITGAAAGWFWWNSQQQKIQQTSQQVGIEYQQPSQEQTPQTPESPQFNPDDILFQNAELINTRQAYSTYLQKYPEGKHIDEAQVKISDFEEQERKAEEQKQQIALSKKEEQDRIEKERSSEEMQKKAEADRQDDKAYTFAETTNTIQAYTTYIQSYPLGRHIDEARKNIADLQQKQAELQKVQADKLAQRDDEAFRIAMNTNTKESYSTYLISFPNGLHSSEAHAKITTLEEQVRFEEKIRLELSSLAITLAHIPSGSFQMGSTNGDGDEKPVRTVSVSGFHMSATEITQAQYRAIIGNNPSFQKLDDNCPVEKVTWNDAITFCNKLSDKVGLEPCYNLSTGTCDFNKNGFRLPTEAEWEYACRANMGTEYNTGDGESALNRAGWYAGNSAEKTHPIGQKTANSLGLYDMHGNVWEWCNDWYSKKSYEIAGISNPAGVDSGKTRIVRGGGYLDWPKDCRSAKRREYNPDRNYSDIGFRIIRR